MKISLVTINYNNAVATQRLLASLEGQIDGDFNIVVVDNGSESEDRDALKGSSFNLPGLAMLWNEANLGFSGGNNIGIKHALERGAEWIVMINNDAWVEKDFIAKLKQELVGCEGVVGIPLIENGLIAYAGRIEWLRPTLKHIHDLVACRLSLADGTAYAIGGGIAIHRNIFNRIGFWDERYFLYFEDADFSMRAAKAGIPITILEQPVIHHDISGSTRKLGAPLLLRYHARNALLFNSLHGPGEVKVALPFVSFFGMVYQFLKIVFLPSKRPESWAILAGIMDFWVDNFGKIHAEHRH